MSLEEHFDTRFAAVLARREKQVQQSYRPVIGIHKWFARRPGTLFRNLLLAEFAAEGEAGERFFGSHALHGVIADPFMGGGTTVYEAARLGLSVVGCDVNPMAWWIVRQGLTPLDLDTFARVAAEVAGDVEREVGALYVTRCGGCGGDAAVKYFLWVAVRDCPACGQENGLFPSRVLAKAVRHPRHVVVCGGCGELNEFDERPGDDSPAPCAACGNPVSAEGNAGRGRASCTGCGHGFAFPVADADRRPRHRMWAIEYHCAPCKPGHAGRFFKRPDAEDLGRVATARRRLGVLRDDLPIPEDPIPGGDETARLHRFGYERFRDLFGPRQLLGLGLLLRRIRAVPDRAVRHALLTVFSDTLRYQNLLCRYDTYALKCQDVFSLHGFPVGLVPCENNVLGIPRVGSGAFRHFVEKYLRAKRYCEAPFETRRDGGRKHVVAIEGERIAPSMVDGLPSPGGGEARISCGPSTGVTLAPESLDGVFTDPPYFGNVQYAELMDFCYAWLRAGLGGDVPEFAAANTRNEGDLTGNRTLGRGIEDFTSGLSAVFGHYAAALKPGAPFVFTYHHNDPTAYAPLVVAMLDAGLVCTATLAAPAEMGASRHIAGTGSSTLDSVFVCRSEAAAGAPAPWREVLEHDLAALAAAGIEATAGDRRCLAAGHVARTAAAALAGSWDAHAPLAQRIGMARKAIAAHAVSSR